MTEAPATPIRVQHNENLAKQFYAQSGIESTVPPVHEQLESVVVNRRAIQGYAYNGSIVKHKGRIFLSFRYHAEPGPTTRLGIAELDNDFNVRRNERIQFNPQAVSVEDPHFFVFRDELYISYVESMFPGKPLSVVKYGLLVEGSPWKVVDVQQPKIGKNDGTTMEKNFVFWEHATNLQCLYRQHTIYSLALELPWQILTPPHWPYGEPRGGCIVPWNGKLLRFFHSSHDFEPRPMVRRYFCGACIMEPNPPFQVTAISKKPILTGSEVCSLTPEERQKCGHYKQGVVFPGGCLTTDSGWILSVGVNDSSIVLVKIKEGDLRL